MTIRHLGSTYRVDVIDGGEYQVVGTTSKKNLISPSALTIPVRCRVRLHDQPSGRLVRETWSIVPSGEYVFNRIRAGTYYVTAFDHTGEYGGVIETDIVAEPMP